MSHDAQLSRLVYMANQIGTFFASRPEEEAIAEIEGHIRKFWDPRMRRQIASLLDREDSGLSSRVRKAVLRLNQTLQMSI